MKFFTAIFLILLIGTLFYIFNQICNKYIFKKEVKRLDFLILVIGVFSFCIILYGLFVADYFLNNPNKNDAGKIEYLGTLGDLIGGLLNPAIAVPATLLTFLAFWVQYKANDEVRKQFHTQQFETELSLKISILRQEISEQKLPDLYNSNYVGREIMYQLDKELRFIYFIVKNSLVADNPKLSLKISYYIFFKGRLLFYKNIDFLANKYNIDKGELENIEIILSHLYTYFKDQNADLNIITPSEYAEIQEQREEYKLNSMSRLHKGLKDNRKINDLLLEFELPTIYDLFSDTYSLNIKHLPFKGHETRLSLLFRQIFNITKFVVSNSSLTYEQQRNYLRTLRSLLSNYDQIHIFYNWYSENAPKWENSKNKYLTDYRMIHNIPNENLIDDFNLEEIFSNRNFKYEEGRKEDDSLFENIEIYSVKK